MIERPILFTGDMVRAIIAGHKTQTRRLVKNAAGAFWDHAAYAPVMHGGSISHWQTIHDGHPAVGGPCVSCPYGQPGDRLWVRETWATTGQAGDHPADIRCVYRADDPDWETMDGWKWTPSIHMPRWASRLTLEITTIRVERLQDIMRSDAMSEGCPFPNMQTGPNPVDWFFHLWSSTYSIKSWHANPWVWVIEFKVLP